jgi:hypothetical protein
MKRMLTGALFGGLMLAMSMMAVKNEYKIKNNGSAMMQASTMSDMAAINATHKVLTGPGGNELATLAIPKDAVHVDFDNALLATVEQGLKVNTGPIAAKSSVARYSTAPALVTNAVQLVRARHDHLRGGLNGAHRAATKSQIANMLAVRYAAVNC